MRMGNLIGSLNFPFLVPAFSETIMPVMLRESMTIFVEVALGFFSHWSQGQGKWLHVASNGTSL